MSVTRQRSAELRKIQCYIWRTRSGHREKLSTATQIRTETLSGAGESTTSRGGAWHRSLAPAAVVLRHELRCIVFDFDSLQVGYD